MSNNRSRGGMSSFWLIVAAIVAFLGVVWGVASFPTVDTPAAEEASVEIDLIWPQIGAVVAIICHAIITLVGFLRQSAMRTLGVISGWLAVAAILVGYIFIGGPHHGRRRGRRGFA